MKHPWLLPNEKLQSAPNHMPSVPNEVDINSTRHGLNQFSEPLISGIAVELASMTCLGWPQVQSPS